MHSVSSALSFKEHNWKSVSAWSWLWGREYTEWI